MFGLQHRVCGTRITHDQYRQPKRAWSTSLGHVNNISLLFDCDMDDIVSEFLIIIFPYFY